jgi:solute carrier family 25 oxoglutarate transporter 11
MTRAMIVTAAQMSCYEQTKEYIILRTAMADSIPVHVAASLVAGGVAAISSNPFDVAKTRLQDMKVGPDGFKPYNNTFDCILKIARAEGGRALYKGFTATWARQAPLNVVRFICLEQFNRLFARIGYSRVIIGPPPEPEPCPHGRIGKCADCLTDKSREIMKHMM